MADERPVRYARTPDGLHVAYQVLGDEPLDLLVLPSSFIPVNSLDEEPSLARFHRRLASFSRLLRFDFRRMGLSDPMPLDDLHHGELVEDALAVLDAAGSTSAAVLAPGVSSLIAISLAAAYPERVSSLVVVNGTARIMPAPDYPVPEPELYVTSADSILEEAPVDGPPWVEVINPSLKGDETFAGWWHRSGLRGASPAVAQAITQAMFWLDVRGDLAAIRCPTLVLHRRGERLHGIEHGRYLAEHINDATLVELPGDDFLYWVGDTDEMLDEIEEFLTGRREGAEPDRRLLTMLFTDIVGSTEHLGELGERRWRDVLDHHDGFVAEQLRRFGGRQVKATGDGVLATFERPSPAIACAKAIADAAAPLGLAIRAGIHTGEVEVRGDDIAGMAVHIAARIAALADPGQILVSRTVADLVAGSATSFNDLGLRELKGVPGTWQLLSVAT
ncbi:MAG TPA: adenylate/guanylate cyclase domain-containing protein [Acidimicrobiales bacterium]|nr:adenylate/guanylate cyclase domain-containing protein [Acidimicrobiales bacterium]